MDEKEKDLKPEQPEFSLEDILREFENPCRSSRNRRRMC